MQLKKQDIHKLFQKLKLEVRATDHIYGWLVVDGKKILRVQLSQVGLLSF
jgi:exoribonuclease II